MTINIDKYITSDEHSALDHTGLTGVPAAEAFTAGVHASTDHSSIPGVQTVSLGFTGVDLAAGGDYLEPWGGSTGGSASGTYEPKGVMLPVAYEFTRLAVHHDNVGAITVAVHKRGTGSVATAEIPASPGGVMTLTGDGSFAAGDVIMLGIDTATGNTNLTAIVM